MSQDLSGLHLGEQCSLLHDANHAQMLSSTRCGDIVDVPSEWVLWSWQGFCYIYTSESNIHTMSMVSAPETSGH